jgi:hypothetical protein
MKYDQHKHDGVIKPGERFDPMGQAAPELHKLLERKGFAFQPLADYYCFGKDSDWQDKPIEVAVGGARPCPCSPAEVRGWSSATPTSF